MIVFVVLYFDGNSDSVVVVCDNRATAESIASRLGDSGRVEEVHFISSVGPKA